MVPRHERPLLSAANRAHLATGISDGSRCGRAGLADSESSNGAMRQLSDGLQIQLVSATGFATSGSMTTNPLRTYPSRE
jgi:hypothetical protein